MDDYLSDLVNGDAQYALGRLLQDLRLYKYSTAKKFFDHPGSEDFLWALLKLFCCSETAMQAGNVAYTISTLAEYNSEALPRFVAVAKSVAKYGLQTIRSLSEFVKPVPNDTSFASEIYTRDQTKLNAQTAESRMNVVGLIATFAEDDDGRSWLVSDPYFGDLLNTLIETFNTKVNTVVETDQYSSQLSLLWTVSNAALVFARLLIDTAFIELLFSATFNDKLDSLIGHLVNALRLANFDKQNSTDFEKLVTELNEAAVALRLNAAFALGRICSHEVGVKHIFKLNLADQFSLLAARLVCTASVYVFKRVEKLRNAAGVSGAASPFVEDLITKETLMTDQSREKSRKRDRHSAASRNYDLDSAADAAVFRVKTAKYLSEDHSAEFKNACYALSSFTSSSEKALATFADENKPHNLHIFDLLVLRILQVIKQCHEDEEAIWFATMLLRDLVSSKPGCRAFRIKNFTATVQDLSNNKRLADEVKQELKSILGRLTKLDPPRFVFNSCTSTINAIQLRWTRVHDQNFNLPIRYKLYECTTQPYLLIREMQLDCITPLESDVKKNQVERINEAQALNQDTQSGWNLIDGDACMKSECFYAVEGLTSGKQYIFRVQAETEVQQSCMSDPITIATKESSLGPVIVNTGSVPEAPRNLRIVTVTTSQIRVVWEPPASSSGTIRKYTVSVAPPDIELPQRAPSQALDQRRGSRELTAIEKSWPKVVTTTELNSIVSGLAAESSYRVSVTASNIIGQSEPAIISASTLRYGPHSPQHIRFQVIGRHEMQLSWEPPQRIVGKLMRYDVTFNRRVVYVGVETRCTVERLKSKTEYKIIVCAQTSVGRFESKPVKRKTASDDDVFFGSDLPPSSKSTLEATDITNNLIGRDSVRKSLPNFTNAQLLSDSTPTAESNSVISQSQKMFALRPTNRLLTRRRFSDFGLPGVRKSGGPGSGKSVGDSQQFDKVVEFEELEVKTRPLENEESNESSEATVKVEKERRSSVKLPNLIARNQTAPKQALSLSAACGVDFQMFAIEADAAIARRKASQKSSHSTGRRRKNQ